MAVRSDENKRSPLKAWVRALERTAPIERDRTLTLPVVIGRLGEHLGDAPALLSTATTLSYRSLAKACNRYARWGLARGLSAGDVVCLVMENCPDYMAIWLGLSGIGTTVALINTHLTGELLAYSLNLVAPRLVIAGPSLCAAVSEVRARLAPGVECWVNGAGSHELPRLDLTVAALPGEALQKSEFRAPTLDERALCIYTSGTTGLPKAANVSHFRLMQWSHWFAGLIDVQPDDRMYNCLPMYHSVGGVVATGATLVGGGAVVLRERFSASAFWKDVVAERCTLFQYIGELCRYLVNNPQQSEESRHALRLACGNGLHGDVWQKFQQRFRIPQILEYYAATEGNFSLYNCEGRVGAIGRIPPFLAHRVPVALVKYDVDAAAPARDAGGRCVRCRPGEAGEAIGQIVGASGRRAKPFDDNLGDARLADVEVQGPQRPECAQLRVPILELFGQLERMRQRRFAPFDGPHRHPERQAQREMKPHAQRIAQRHVGLEMSQRALGALGAFGEQRRMRPCGRAVRSQHHTNCRVARGRERPIECRPDVVDLASEAT